MPTALIKKLQYNSDAIWAGKWTKSVSTGAPLERSLQISYSWIKEPTHKGKEREPTTKVMAGYGERKGREWPCLSSENPLKCALACPVTHTYRKTSNILWVSAYFRPITDSSTTVWTRSDCQFCQSAVIGLIIIATPIDLRWVIGLSFGVRKTVLTIES